MLANPFPDLIFLLRKNEPSGFEMAPLKKILPNPREGVKQVAAGVRNHSEYNITLQRESNVVKLCHHSIQLYQVVVFLLTSVSLY